MNLPTLLSDSNTTNNGNNNNNNNNSDNVVNSKLMKHGGALVEEASLLGNKNKYQFSIPMKGRLDCNFSFSGN